MSAESFREAVSNKLKSCRESRGLSLDATARATGVSKAMLGQIERLESAPTIATLWKIAKGLNLSFSSFFARQSLPHTRQSMFPNDPNMQIEVIFPFDPATRMEMFQVTLTNHHHQRSTPHQAGVVEHVVALRGVVEVMHEQQWSEVSQGGTLRFHADAPHEYRAVTKTAVFQNIICYTWME